MQCVDYVQHNTRHSARHDLASFGSKMAAWYLVPFVFVVDLVAVVAIALVLVVLHVFLVLRGAVRLCWREPPPISRGESVMPPSPDTHTRSLAHAPTYMQR